MEVSEKNKTLIRKPLLNDKSPLLCPFLGLVTAVVLSGVFPLMLIAEITNTFRSHAWTLTMIIMVCSGLRLSFLIGSGRPRLFEFIVWLFAYVFFGLAATVQFRSGNIAGTTPGLDPNLDFPSAVMVAVGLASFYVGIKIYRPRKTRHLNGSFVFEINVTRANILLLVGAGFAIYYISKIGFGNLFQSRESLNIILAQVWPNISTMATFKAAAIFPLLVASQALIQAKHNQNVSSKYTKSNRRKAVLAAIGVMSITNPISTARYVFGSVWGGFLLSLGAYANRIRTSLSMLGIILGLLLVFPLADMFRYNKTLGVFRNSFFGEYAGNGDYDAIGQISNTLAYIHDKGITWGDQFVGVIFFWVPRIFWPDKAQDTGVLLAEYRGYGFTNLSAPLWSEALINFGLVGLVATFVLLGVLVAGLDVAGARALKDGGFILIPLAILPFYLLIVLRGSLLQATGSFVVMILCILFVRGRSRPLNVAGKLTN
ncbi:hypothetical protein [Arthrobacter sp. STN4]|uniref:hypothetical protein n=1 Tax=Arthrobacter sp. STN4 TaxID=2923276 RepID=UPI00211A5D6D|nr:hypothetical protein [Arthrobacter sp. STN4]MCQ9163665.1 hypothetical protein [Arthrobacter sp. STN4]